MKETILKNVLKNAYDFNGSVNPKVVLGLTLRDSPDLKKDVPAVMQEINQAITAIKNLSKEELKKRLAELAPELLEEEKEETIKGPLKPLPKAKENNFVVRIAPSPSGPLHIGHAYGASLNYEYAKMYKGKLIVRIEDTNPENIYPQAYDLITEDTQWLTENNVAQVIIQSERLGIYYDYAEKLIDLGKAYVCTCNPDEWREMKSKSQACPCRDLETKEQQLRYAKLFNEYAEGEAVLKLKTDIKDKNPAMRDFSIMRINEHVHPKTGTEQRVWPLMVLSVAIDDHELGITHVLNGKDHADNAKKEAMIMECFGWQVPEYKHWGRINFDGFELSSSKTRLKIEQGEYANWEDIRLPFLPALRKRGYQAGAFRKYALEIGLSLNDKKVSLDEFWKNINSFNRELIEAKANRYFFIENPVRLEIKNGIQKEVQIDLHPEFPERGKRIFNASGIVYLAENDWHKLATGKIHRLMDYCNIKKEDHSLTFVSESYEDYKNHPEKGMIIHWLPEEGNLEVDIIDEEGRKIQGLGEQTMNNLEMGEIVQLERMYFSRLDQKEKKKLVFWYLHK